MIFKLLCKESKKLIRIVFQCKYSSKAILGECAIPYPPMNILITGANCEVGQITAFFLKQSSSVSKVSLYDRKCTASVVDELKVIPTSADVKCYVGRQCLPAAVKDARIVVICGGHQKYTGDTEHDLFRGNADYVREIVMYVTEFNPRAHICISTPPVACLVPMAIEEGKKGNVDNSNRVYGIVTQNLMRARSLTGHEFKVSPENLSVSVVGGEHRRLCIPVLSQTNQAMTPLKNEMLTRSIQESEIDVLYAMANEKEPDLRCCYYTIACATAKFVLSLIKAIEGENIYECAFVKQQPPLDELSRYLTTVVKLGFHGIEDSKIPKLSAKEQQRLKTVMEEIHENIYIGESFVTGDEKPVRRRIPDEDMDEPFMVVKRPIQHFNWEKCEEAKQHGIRQKANIGNEFM